jgi:dTDP-4-dehydrorhamnose 3,5-epimerase-like enzyme
MADTKRMQAGDVTPEWLQSLSNTLVPSSKPTTIDGVYVKDLKTHLVGRGDVIELWSKSWVEKEGLVVPEHVYQSATDYGVTK